MIAKLVVWGEDRDECIERSLRALREYQIGGIPTIIPFHRLMLTDEEFVQSTHTTKYLDEELDESRIEEAQEQWGGDIGDGGASEQGGGRPLDGSLARRNRCGPLQWRVRPVPRAEYVVDGDGGGRQSVRDRVRRPRVVVVDGRSGGGEYTDRRGDQQQAEGHVEGRARPAIGGGERR